MHILLEVAIMHSTTCSIQYAYSSMHTVLEYLVDNMHIVCIVALATS